MSKLSEALEAMDKATPWPWEAIKPFNSNGFWYINNHSTSNGEIATNYGKKARHNANIIAAAPDALSWIKEALPYITEYRDALATNLENCDFGPREEGAARKELAHLDALIARAKPEEVGR